MTKMSQTQPMRASLSWTPNRAQAIFDALHFATVTSAACIYGGAIRDADCSAKYGRQIPIKDYDMRVWLPQSAYHQGIEIIRNDFSTLGANVKDVTYWPSDTKKEHARCEIEFVDCVIDMSFRGKDDALFDNMKELSTLVAIDRVKDSDVGLSAVALDDHMRTWILPQYLFDRNNCQITLLRDDTRERGLAYAQRLQEQKYPNHIIVG